VIQNEFVFRVLVTREKIAWAVKAPGPDGEVIHLDFLRHATPEEAIQAYEEKAGRTWAECVKAGAKLVEQKMIERTG
jgi:hypothetical protein